MLIRASFFLLLASFEWKDNALFNLNSGTAGSTLHFMLDLVGRRYFESKVLFLRRYWMVILMFQQFTTKQVVIIRPAQHCADRRDNLTPSREQKLVQAPTSHIVGRYNCGAANPAAWSTTGGNSRSSAVNLAKLKRYLHLDTARNSWGEEVITMIAMWAPDTWHVAPGLTWPRYVDMWCSQLAGARPVCNNITVMPHWPAPVLCPPTAQISLAVVDWVTSTSSSTDTLIH